MSETMSVFVGSGPSVQTCRQFVENHLHVTLAQRMDSEGLLFEGEVSGAHVALFDNHGLVDDCGIEFTQFPLEIDFTRYAGTSTPNRDEATFHSLAVSLAEGLSKEFRSHCIVVKDLQRVVHDFRPSLD